MALQDTPDSPGREKIPALWGNHVVPPTNLGRTGKLSLGLFVVVLVLTIIQAIYDSINFQTLMVLIFMLLQTIPYVMRLILRRYDPHDPVYARIHNTLLSFLIILAILWTIALGYAIFYNLR